MYELWKGYWSRVAQWIQPNYRPVIYGDSRSMSHGSMSPYARGCDERHSFRLIGMNDERPLILIGNIPEHRRSPGPMRHDAAPQQTTGGWADGPPRPADSERRRLCGPQLHVDLEPYIRPQFLLSNTHPRVTPSNHSLGVSKNTFKTAESIFVAMVCHHAGAWLSVIL